MPIRSRLLPLLLVGSFVTGCRSAPETIVHSLDAALPPGHEGMPAPWRAWLGFDPFSEAQGVDWEDRLTRESDGELRLFGGRPTDGSLFEIAHRARGGLRRWYVLIRPAAGPDDTIRFANVTMTRKLDGSDEKRKIELLSSYEGIDVAVAPDGGEPAPARRAFAPVLSSSSGYTNQLDGALEASYEKLLEDRETAAAVEDRYFVAVSRPVLALLSLFQGIQGHPELSSILREVVEAPSVLAIVLAGGLELQLEPDLAAMEETTFVSPRGHRETAVRFPATISANGKPALEMELTATAPVRPVHLTGGLVGLRAWRPSQPDETVTLRILGAREAEPTD